MAQTKERQKPSANNRKDDNCMLSGSFGQPMNIETHEKESKKVTHTSSDFIQFNENGTYVEMINGKECKGTWVYDYSKHTVTTSCNSKTWTVNKSTNNRIEMSTNSEKLKLLRKN